MNRAIFLDRDGVINEEKEFVYKKEDVNILRGVLEALEILKNKGYILICITNQAAIARGFTNEKEVEELHEFMNQKLKGNITEFYFCPHHPEMHDDVPDFAKKYRIKCDCRKPSPGLLLRAAKKYNINLNESWMIGDMITDIVAGKSVGCKTIMVESPKNKQIISTPIKFDLNIKPDIYVKNLKEATKFL